MIIELVVYIDTKTLSTEQLQSINGELNTFCSRLELYGSISADMEVNGSDDWREE